jgi:hypothetical protein
VGARAIPDQWISLVGNWRGRSRSEEGLESWKNNGTLSYQLDFSLGWDFRKCGF